jgi:ABC-type dipeptide/oligopeptide/nickel transport system permease component
MIPVAFLASVILFVLLKLTLGDPVYIILDERATAENYQALRHALGLDDPRRTGHRPVRGRVELPPSSRRQ